MYSMLIHGGAGDWPPEDEPAALAGMRRALEAGDRLLAAGADAVDAVVSAVVVLEDDPVFNAGTGACLNLDGEVELDASVMAGADMRCGGVAALKRVRNPVLVARKVMEETDHCLLAGEGARAFARAAGFADHDPVTERALARYDERLRALRGDGPTNLPRLRARLRNQHGIGGGTVGAVALDASGRLAAATSTGGISLKLPGRVGDTPIPGAGNYASPHAAASATGHGELILRTLATRTLCDLIADGRTAGEAVEAMLARLAGDLPAGVGFIALDRAGGMGVAHDTADMPHGWFRQGQAEVSLRMRLSPPT
jgi:beta-aspartyl-peptidase (threonine type)